MQLRAARQSNLHLHRARRAASCRLSHAPGRSPLSAWVGPKCAPSAPRSCWQPAAARLTAPQRKAVADPNPASAALSLQRFHTLIAQSRWC